jgi:ribosomal-protein-alanine N-acetyltransferase
MAAPLPVLRDGDISMRSIRLRDAKAVERELMENRPWLRKWEATNPYAPLGPWDMRGSIRSLLSQARQGTGLPFVMEYRGEIAGQLNVSGIVYGSVSSATLGYWVAERFAGHGITPTSVALATDHVFFTMGLHRMEICIRPENAASLRVVEKLGFRYEGLRRRFIHINGSWADHFSFALVREEVPGGVLARWKDGRVPPGATTIPDADRAAAATPLVTPDS